MYYIKEFHFFYCIYLFVVIKKLISLFSFIHLFIYLMHNVGNFFNRNKISIVI